MLHRLRVGGIQLLCPGKVHNRNKEGLHAGKICALNSLKQVGVNLSVLKLEKYLGFFFFKEKKKKFELIFLSVY